jgi:hypothetical protein
MPYPHDGDGLVDFPADTDCAALDKSSEGDGPPPTPVPVASAWGAACLVLLLLGAGGRRVHRGS